MIYGGQKYAYFLDVLGHENSPERVLRLMNESGFIKIYARFRLLWA